MTEEMPSVFLVYGSPAQVVRLHHRKEKRVLDYLKEAKLYKPLCSVYLEGRHLRHASTPASGSVLLLRTNTPGI